MAPFSTHWAQFDSWCQQVLNILTYILCYISILYLPWANSGAGNAFHRTWAIVLLSFAALTHLLQQQNGLASTLFVFFIWFLNDLVAFLLSPAQVVIFSLGSPQQARPIDEFVPKNTPKSQAGQNITVDIVAVHGLASSPDTAWAYRLDEASRDAPGSQSQLGPLWLRDFLPLDELQARVLVYYHNSGWQAHASGMSLRDYGQELLNSVESARRTAAERTRPIIFIGYSFGGLTIKQAMVIAQNKSTARAPRRLSSDDIRGFLFLGTPHGGANLTPFAKAISFLGYWQGASTTLLEVITQGSEENETLHDDFLKLHDSKDIINVFEVRQEYVGPFAIMNAVSKSSATIPGKISASSPGKHREIHRFKSKEDVGYLKLYQFIAKLIDDNIVQTTKEDSPIQCFHTLSNAVESAFLQNQSRGDDATEAMDWLLQSPDFTNWMSKRESRFLWYQDRAGAGKTTTTRHLVKILKKRYTPNLSFFLCSREFKISSCKSLKPLTSAALVAFIISQFSGNFALQDILANAQKHLPANLDLLGPGIEAPLWKILQAVLRGALKNQKEVWIVVDGVDEMPHDDRQSFLRHLRGIWDDVEADNQNSEEERLKILIVSRPVQDMLEILDGLPSFNPVKEVTDCLSSLSSRSANERRSLVSLGEDTTGAWLWADDAFRAWHNSFDSALLWIQGKPGSGKSTLSKKILERIIRQHNLADIYDIVSRPASSSTTGTSMPLGARQVIASFFYSLRGATSETNNTQMLQSLLYQLLYQDRELYPVFQGRFRDLVARANGRIAAVHWSFDDIREAFTLLAKLNNHPLAIFLVIDGMDESDKKERAEILSMLKVLCNRESGCVVKCVLASRPEDDIKGSLLPEDKRDGFFHLILERKNERDLNKFIESRMDRLEKSYLKKLATLSNSAGSTTVFKDLIQDTTYKLKNHARGVFLWVEIVTRQLERLVQRGYTPLAIRKTLESLPQELEPFYERIVDELLDRFKEGEAGKTNDELVQEARQMLTWATYAEQPLTVEEFQDATAILDPTGDNLAAKFHESRLPDKYAMMQRLVYVCGDLLEIRPAQRQSIFVGGKEESVQLLHLTTREFLTQDSRAGKLSLKRFQGQNMILLNSISYLRLFAETCPSGEGLVDMEQSAALLVPRLRL